MCYCVWHHFKIWLWRINVSENEKGTLWDWIMLFITIKETEIRIVSHVRNFYWFSFSGCPWRCQYCTWTNAAIIFLITLFELNFWWIIKFFIFAISHKKTPFRIFFINFLCQFWLQKIKAIFSLHTFFKYCSSDW